MLGGIISNGSNWWNPYFLHNPAARFTDHPTRYRDIIQKQYPYALPDYDDLPAVMDIVDITVKDLYDIAGIDCLLPGQKEFMDQLAELSPAKIDLLYNNYPKVFHWQTDKFTYDARTPALRLYLLNIHRRIDTKQQRATVSRKKTEISEDEMYLRVLINLTSARSFAGLEGYINAHGAFTPPEVLPKIANHINVTVRWIFGYNDIGSFYGYPEKIERLCDLYWLAYPHQKRYMDAFLEREGVPHE